MKSSRNISSNPNKIIHTHLIRGYYEFKEGEGRVLPPSRIFLNKLKVNATDDELNAHNESTVN